jgi:hypothetical protein
MGEVHSLIIRHGVEVARSMAATKAERNAIEAAASIMGEEESRMGITHAGFAMTSLPHKRIEETVWRQAGPNTTLLVASGHTEQGRPIGVPYGSIARLILLYLQTEAIRTGSAEVELGRSMNAWLTKMNLAHRREDLWFGGGAGEAHLALPVNFFRRQHGHEGLRKRRFRRWADIDGFRL